MQKEINDEKEEEKSAENNIRCKSAIKQCGVKERTFRCGSLIKLRWKHLESKRWLMTDVNRQDRKCVYTSKILLPYFFISFDNVEKMTDWDQHLPAKTKNTVKYQR